MWCEFSHGGYEHCHTGYRPAFQHLRLPNLITPVYACAFLCSALVAALILVRRRPARSPLNLDETGREGAHVANLQASGEDTRRGPTSV
jgi:hypothetical protein